MLAFYFVIIYELSGLGYRAAEIAIRFEPFMESDSAMRSMSA
jgi:hypothetical protein